MRYLKHMHDKLKRKKILYLVTQAEWGGAQKYVYDLAGNLDKNKYIVEVAVGEQKKQATAYWIKKLEDKGIKVWRLRHVVRELNIWHDFMSIFELYVLFLKSKPDIIHLNSSKVGSTGAVMGWLYKKFCRSSLKIIYTVHGFVFTEPLSYWRRKFYLWSEKVSAKLKDRLICVSERDKIIGLNSHIAYHKKFITIHNGINLNKLEFLEKNQAREKISSKNPIPQVRYWVGIIANLYSTKGLEYAVRAANILTEKYSSLIFIVIGEGSQRKYLEKEIEKLNLQNKFFLIGDIPKAFQYLKAFDLFCLPSVKEGFPYTLVEALAAGLPVVTTQAGGIVEIVEPEVNGLVVEPKKPRELAKAIETLIDKPELCSLFSHNNLEKAKIFSLERMINATEKVYLNF